MPKGGLPIVAFAALLVIGTGCVWRGDSADHYIGPLFYGPLQTSAKVGHIDEQVHFPILIETGRQWGVSLGIMRRIAASPRIINPSQPLDQLATPEIVRQFLSIPITRRLAFSPLYLRIDRRTNPEFKIRSLVGFQTSGGEDGYFLSAGLATTREFIPRHVGPYMLCHESRNPLDTTLVIYRNSTDVLSAPC